jgi:hypothetical protein
MTQPCLDVSTRSATELTPARAARLQELAAELNLHLPALIEVINRRVLATVPDLVQPNDPTWNEAVAHSTIANVGAMLTMLSHGVPATAAEPPAGAFELFDRLAERHDGLEVILRGYRSGLAELWQLWARHLADHVDDADDLYALLAASTSFIMTFIARVSDGLTIRWEQTHRRRERGLNATPEEIIRGVLYDAAPPPGALEPLGYDSRRVHLAFALSAETSDERQSEMLARLRGLTAAQTLSLRRDAGLVIWVALDGAPAIALRETLEVTFRRSEAVGASEPRSGLDGFRTTYHEALDARRIALLRSEKRLTHYRDVALLSVLTADPERARALALTELGELAAESAGMARLRETLRAYLACGQSQVATASRLGVHEKTVAYRVRKAEDMLGVSIRDGHTEIESSLLIHAALAGDR